MKTPLVVTLAFSIPTSFLLADAHESTAPKSGDSNEMSESKEKKKKHKFDDISVDDLKAAIDAGSVTIIDVNGMEKYKKGHVPGAVSFHTVKESMEEALPDDKAALIVAYCSGPT